MATPEEKNGQPHDEDGSGAGNDQRKPSLWSCAHNVGPTECRRPPLKRRGADTRHAPRRDREAPARNMKQEPRPSGRVPASSILA